MAQRRILPTGAAVTLITTCLLWMIPAAASATDWPMFQAGPTHSGVTTDPGPDDATLLWSTTTEAAINGQAAVVGDRIYFVNEQGVLYCLNKADGAVLWAESGHGRSNDACPAILNNDNKIYIGHGPNDDGVFCRQASNGELLWEKEHYGNVPGPVTVVNDNGTNKVFYCTDAGYVLCRNADTGDLIWEYQTDGGQNRGGPAVDAAHKRRVYVGTYDGRVICLPTYDQDSGKNPDSDGVNQKFWEFTPTGDAIIGTPSLYWDASGKMEIFVGLDKYQYSDILYALWDDGDHGAEDWYITGSVGLRTSPAVDEGRVWAVSEDGTIYAFLRSGGQQFAYDTNGSSEASSPAVAGQPGQSPKKQKVYATVGSTENKLFCLTAEAQTPGDPPTEIWSDGDGYYHSTPSIAAGVLYVGEGKQMQAFGTSSGTVSAKAAFPVGRNESSALDTIRVLFDREVAAAGAQNNTNYSFTTVVGSSVLDASFPFPDTDHSVVDLVVSGLPTNVTHCQLYAYNLQDSTTHTLAGPLQVDLWIGCAKVSALQAPDLNALAGSPCEDRSSFAGQSGGLLGDPVSFRGICIANVGGWSYLADHLGATQRAGIRVAAPGGPFAFGHQYLVAGRVHESSGETAVSSVYYVEDEGAMTPPSPVTVRFKTIADSTCDQSRNIVNGEDYEGMVVSIPDTLAVVDDAFGGSFRVTDPLNDTGMILVDMDAGPADLGEMPIGTRLNISGVIRERSDVGMMSISPLSTSSVVVLGAPSERTPSDVTFAVFPNPARTPRLSFTLPERSLVELSVFDVAGRKLKTLAAGMFEPGAYDQMVWDGTDASGTVVGPGLFFYRLRVGGETYVVRGVRLD